MKILSSALFCAFLFFSFNANAKIWGRDFNVKSFATIEYQAPSLSGAGDNADFKTNNFGKQLSNFENIAIGGHFRINERFGVNINFVQTSLNHYALQGVSLSQKARFSLDQYNMSALFFKPIQRNLFEVFGEAGVSNMNSKLKYVSTEAHKDKSRETMVFVGAGMQITPFRSNDAIRFSVQRYLGKLDLLNTNYTTVRVGFIKSF